MMYSSLVLRNILRTSSRSSSPPSFLGRIEGVRGVGGGLVQSLSFTRASFHSNGNDNGNGSGANGNEGEGRKYSVTVSMLFLFLYSSSSSSCSCPLVWSFSSSSFSDVHCISNHRLLLLLPSLLEHSFLQLMQQRLLPLKPFPKSLEMLLT
jgi:hypothetical protein